MKDSSAGWFLIIMGIVYIAALTRPGQRLAGDNPNLARWGLVAVSLLVLLALVIGVVLLLN
jgi:hypothetical protein